jgi:hypothetical protein
MVPEPYFIYFGQNSGAVITTLFSLAQKSKYVCPFQAFQSKCYVTLYPFRLICKLRRISSVVNTAHEQNSIFFLAEIRGRIHNTLFSS